MAKYIPLALSLLLIFSCKSETKEKTSVPSPAKKTAKATNEKTILFFGNSLTAAYGLDTDQGFPALIQEKIDEKQLDYNVINAGLSGETTAGGLGRVDWMLKTKIDVFVLELGGNDGLRGIDPKSSKKNLQGIIDKVKATYPSCTILLAGMEAPPNMGKEFTSQFRNMYKELAKANSIQLIPFLLDKVAGEKRLNLADGIHPNVEGQKIVAENVWRVLEAVL